VIISLLISPRKVAVPCVVVCVVVFVFMFVYVLVGFFILVFVEFGIVAGLRIVGSCFSYVCVFAFGNKGFGVISLSINKRGCGITNNKNNENTGKKKKNNDKKEIREGK
jgi:hypothetical protein